MRKLSNNLRMINSKKYIVLSIAGAGLLSMVSCVKHPDSPGYEYTPDMYRSEAIEAYVDYGIVADKHNPDLQLKQSARVPAVGTIPFYTCEKKAALEMPYSYPNTNEGYEMAGEKLKNPIKFSKEALAEGKELYERFCDHCHGETGKGDGLVVTQGQHAAPGAYDGALKDLSVGKMFHTLTYGKGMMGSHASQMSKEERWKVIFYVQALQNGGTYPEVVEETVEVKEVEIEKEG
jgi:mono/diheme cytochrome c family protein